MENIQSLKAAHTLNMEFFGVKGEFQELQKQEPLFIKNREVKGDTFVQKMDNSYGYLNNVNAEEILGEGWSAISLNDWGENNVKANTDAGFEKSDDSVMIKKEQDGSRTFKKILYNETTGQYARVETKINADGTAERTFEVEENTSGTEQKEESYNYQLGFLLKQNSYLQQAKGKVFDDGIFNEYSKDNKNRISEILAKMTGRDVETIKKEIDEGKLSPNDYLKGNAEAKENSKGAIISRFDMHQRESFDKANDALVEIDKKAGNGDGKLTTKEFKSFMVNTVEGSNYDSKTKTKLKNIINTMDSIFSKYADADDIFDANEYLSMLSSKEYGEKLAEYNDTAEHDGSLDIMNRNVKGDTIKQTYKKGDKDNDIAPKDVLGKDWNTLKTNEWGEDNLKSNYEQGFKASDEGTLVKENEDGSKTYKQILKRTTGQYARVLTTVFPNGTIERQLEVEQGVNNEK